MASFSFFFFKFISLFYVYEYTVAVQMVVNHMMMWLLDLCFALAPLTSAQRFIIIRKYTVADFRHTRRGHQISLQMVVSHHVVAGI
jgi:Na+(H+)/acetate symporter ActP